MLNANATLANA